MGFIVFENSALSAGYADVSVILPHFNATNTVGRAINSVVLQSQGVRELIIIDDFSCDFENLLKIVDEFKDLILIKLLRLDFNRGASEARNHGVNVATGKYLAFLDSDDVWHPDKIRIQYSLMIDLDLKFSGHLYVQNVVDVDMDIVFPILIKKIFPISFIYTNPFFTPTVMVKKICFIPFDKRYRRVDDYKCWLMNTMSFDTYVISAPMAGGFKRAIGASGLTSSISLMHESYLVVLNDLYRDRVIGLKFFLAAIFVEFIKYPLRVFKYKFLEFID